MKKKTTTISLAAAGVVSGLPCALFVAPTSNAATPSNGFEFFHNSIADTVKFCVDEWDQSGQHRIYHKCVRVSPTGLKIRAVISGLGALLTPSLRLDIGLPGAMPLHAFPAST